ncbi:hypothetical protein SAMN06272771_6451 [Streptomyces sp. Ag82_O1-12]|nr:hypothetical protein SAMN06272771_6451 [Streptomyces sp. Ag82_O1-12]SOD48992.1 hypothetical protein SAMN06272727_6455 [Streptomyces sp. Ag82_G6-1]
MVAGWAGESPGWLSRGYNDAKSSFRHSPPRRSRTHIAFVSPGLLARATCAVRVESVHPDVGGGTRTTALHA